MDHVALLLKHMNASTLAQMYANLCETESTRETRPLLRAVREQLICLAGNATACNMIREAIDAR